MDEKELRLLKEFERTLDDALDKLQKATAQIVIIREAIKGMIVHEEMNVNEKE